MKSKQKLTGTTAIIASAFFFGSYGVWSRLIEASFGEFYQAWSRGLIIVACLLPLALWQKKLVPIKKADRKWFLLVSLAGALTFAPYFYAFSHMDIGTATLFFYASLTIGVFGIGKVVFKEELTLVKLTALGLGIAGLLVLFSLSLEANQWLPALAAIAAGLAGAAEVALSKKISRDYSPEHISLILFMTTVVVNLPLSLAAGESFAPITLSVPWLAQMAYAFSQLAAFYFVIIGFKHLEPSVASLLGLLEIVFAVILGVLLFGESVTALTLIGGLLIVLAAALPDVVALLKIRT